MSVKVLDAVWEHSQATGGDLLVLLALADEAHSDGVSWYAQEHFARKARVDERTVRRAIAKLEGDGEIEIRKAQRARRRINVYRVTLGAINDRPVDYDRLPFALTAPFTSKDETPLTTGRDVRSSGERPPDTPVRSLSKGTRYAVPLLTKRSATTAELELEPGGVKSQSATSPDGRGNGNSGAPKGDGRSTPVDAPGGGRSDLVTLAFAAYADAGGVLNKERRGKLAQRVGKAEKGGAPADAVLDVVRDIGRRNGWPGDLDDELAVRVAEGPACVYDGYRRGLTPAQLRECSCRLCPEYADFREREGVAA